MIITCGECSTSFNLDDSLVKEAGSKVRCSVCKNTFTVYPLPREPEQADGENPDFIPEEAPIFEDTSDFNMEDTDFSLKDSELDFESQDLILEDSEFTTQDLEQKDNDFDGIEFEPMAYEAEEPGLSMEEGETEKDNEFELEFDVDDDSTDGLSNAPDPKKDDPPLEMMLEFEDKEETPTLERDEPEEELAEITPEDDFSDYDAVLEQKNEPEDNSDDKEPVRKDTNKEETIEEKPLIEESVALMDLLEKKSIRKKKPLVSLPVLLFLLIFLVAAGAYVASIMTGYKIPYLPDVKIPFVEKYLKKTAPAATDIKPIPNENSVNGRFVSNSAGGTLFVITGRVDNPSTLSFSHIEVQGALSTKETPVAKTKNAFCGNIITEEMLKTGDIAEISKLLEVKDGNHNSNVNIKPGASVPFMVVFSDLPEKLQNFNVKVVGFVKASSN